MEVNRRQKSGLNIFEDRFGPIFMFRIDLHMLMVKVPENNFWRYRPKTATTVLMAEKAHVEYGSAGSFVGDDTKFGRAVRGDKESFSLVHCRNYRIKVNRRQRIGPNLFSPIDFNTVLLLVLEIPLT